MEQVISTSRFRWWIVAAVVTLAFVFAGSGLGWDRFAASWAGAAVKATSGAALGWFLSRYAVRLDLSAIDPEARAVAGLAQAVLIGCGMMAVAFGI